MTQDISANQSHDLSGSTLKIIAIVTMFIDHIGAIFVRDTIPYYACRFIGRIAFPIFAFLLVEGFFHTKNVKKYCLRLALFALLSEIPFDLAFAQTLYNPESQNVFFTLCIGLLTISVMEYIKNNLLDKETASFFCRALTATTGMLLAWFLKTDYHAVGVCVILLLYVFHNKKIMSIASACLCLFFALPLEIASFAAIPLVSCYDGRRGISLKYFFYLFYPLHLLLLYFCTFFCA
ncbi:MAG: conjugal transfer protein TraX [Ruminococcus flavefaciens]|nr:conjugal transfer protein TraX [Ruminococcus flavefaciens]